MTWRTFVVRGIPKAQPRPKAYVRTGRASVYDPGTADSWKHCVVIAGSTVRPAVPIPSDVRVFLLVDLPRPKRLLRKMDPEGAVPCPCKPDIDNLAKSTLDAMTDDGWWVDDAQITDLRVVKRYHGKSGHPGATITVWW
jgi:Holliday junction resolvase RusA-like endonuclease